jgi:hypothetical protein
LGSVGGLAREARQPCRITHPTVAGGSATAAGGAGSSRVLVSSNPSPGQSCQRPPSLRTMRGKGRSLLPKQLLAVALEGEANSRAFGRTVFRSRLRLKLVPPGLPDRAWTFLIVGMALMVWPLTSGPRAHRSNRPEGRMEFLRTTGSQGGRWPPVAFLPTASPDAWHTRHT